MILSTNSTFIIINRYIFNILKIYEIINIV